MDSRIERIPVPAAQRWEILRERTLPVVCLVVTLAACGWLWQRQGRIAPFVHGEVGAEVIAIRSPVDGELLPVEGRPDGQWPIFADVKEGAVAVRLKRTDHEETIDVPAPTGGVITKVLGRPGQWIARGETILEISSPKPTYILCHVPDSEASLPKIGGEVAIRLRGAGNRWAAAMIEGVGPIVTTATVYDGSPTGVPVRGLPVRIALPPEMPLQPGALVDVRFPPVGSKL